LGLGSASVNGTSQGSGSGPLEWLSPPQSASVSILAPVPGSSQAALPDGPAHEQCPSDLIFKRGGGALVRRHACSTIDPANGCLWCSKKRPIDLTADA
jgi:hypothetical protein